VATYLPLVAQLRRRIKDERVTYTAFSLACVDQAATDCLVSISSYRLSTTVINGRKAPAINVDLTDFQYDTIKKLTEYLQSLGGYQVNLEQGFNPDHPSRDLQAVGSMSIVGQAVPFRHHIFSDDELRDILVEACRRHNLSYSPETLPENEHGFVLTLASAIVQRELAKDAAKRRNLETTVDQLLAIAAQEEQSYKDDIRRQQRAIPVAKVPEDDTGTGDVMVGGLWRRSMRTGFNAPMASAMEPTPPVLVQPDPRDIEDTKVTLRWKRNHDLQFYSFELWRDTVPVIDRPKGLQLITDAPNLLRSNVKLPFTAKLVYRSYGPHTNKDRIGFATFIESAGQLITEFTDVGADGATGPIEGTLSAPPLEPSTTYYYRMFVQSLNYEITGSNTIAVTTLPLRALLSSIQVPPLSPTTGTAGTLVTVKGVRFTGLNVGSPPGSVTLGGKPVVNLTIVNDSTLTFQVPTFYNPNAVVGSMDLVVTSPNTGLIDVYAQAFRYRAS